MSMNHFKKTLCVLSVSMFCLSGCGAKTMPVSFTEEDYSNFSKIQKDVFNEQSLNDHIDSVLGLEKYTFFDFLGETTPYSQIALSCIHKGALKLNQNKNSSYRIVKTPELEQCIKEVSQHPVMADVMLTHNLGWTIQEASSSSEVKTLIQEAKNDNVLTVVEFLRIGSVSNRITANAIIQSDSMQEMDTSVAEENFKKIEQFVIKDELRGEIHKMIHHPSD